jgi:hypothetical protein
MTYVSQETLRATSPALHCLQDTRAAQPSSNQLSSPPCESRSRIITQAAAYHKAEQSTQNKDERNINHRDPARIQGPNLTPPSTVANRPQARARLSVSRPGAPQETTFDKEQMTARTRRH